jgi:hypothetical protein
MYNISHEEGMNLKFAAEILIETEIRRKPDIQLLVVFQGAKTVLYDRVIGYFLVIPK